MFGLLKPGVWFAPGFIPGTDGKPDDEKSFRQDPELEMILEMWDVLPD
ncbi:MAG: hypothetical protein JXA08_02695 [Methanomicrobiaceae archaeon]|nr:hypothetical protein [Methanomicrobiaceae archaeon]